MLTWLPPAMQRAQGLLNAAPLDLRANLARITREAALEALRNDGIEGERTPFSPAGIRLKGKPAINRHPLFLDGLVEVQRRLQVEENLHGSGVVEARAPGPAVLPEQHRLSCGFLEAGSEYLRTGERSWNTARWVAVGAPSRLFAWAP